MFKKQTLIFKERLVFESTTVYSVLILIWGLLWAAIILKYGGEK